MRINEFTPWKTLDMACARFGKMVVATVVLATLLPVVGETSVLAVEQPVSTAIDIPQYATIERHAGGETTVSSLLRNAYNLPAANLSASDKLNYFSGHSFFKNPWVRAPATTTARDGLGPLFNTNSCKACHIRNGRGSVESEGLLLRLSRQQEGRYVGDRFYGNQLQHRAIFGNKPEGKWRIGWREYKVMVSGGATVSLRAPQFEISHWAQGEPDPKTRWSARIAPAMIGLGLLERIAERDILDHAERQRADPGPVAGRPSWVEDRLRGNKKLGRFGWKALQPTVRQQSAKAFSLDMGLTTSVYPETDCTAYQTHCREQTTGGYPEVSDSILAAVTYYVSSGAVPAARNTHAEAFARGREMFFYAGCGECHRPHWRTPVSGALPAQDIWPYTDLLLHDMGNALAAQTGEDHVNGNEWRTPPLWGIGLAKVVNPDTGFLHDGRARTLLEAIMWHGGEAEASRQSARLMSTSQRRDLIYFLNSL